MGLEVFVNDWNALKTKVERNKTNPWQTEPAWTPFGWYDGLVEGVVQKVRGMKPPQILLYANKLLLNEPKYDECHTPMHDTHKSVDERVPSAAAYVLGIFLGEKPLQQKALSQYFGYNPAYAHDLASTLNDSEGLHSTANGLAELGNYQARAWHTAIDLRFADVIKKVRFGKGEPESIGKNLQNYDKLTQMWVLDTLGIKGKDRAEALKYANPAKDAA